MVESKEKKWDSLTIYGVSSFLVIWSLKSEFYFSWILHFLSLVNWSLGLGSKVFSLQISTCEKVVPNFDSDLHDLTSIRHIFEFRDL